MEIFLGVVALVVIILTGMGLREWKILQKAEDAAGRAQAAAERGRDLVSDLEKNTSEAKRLAETASQAAGESSRHIEAMKNSLVEAWSGDIGRAFAELPDLEAEWQFVFKARSLAPEVSIQFEDLDALFVICDRLKIPAGAEVMIDGLLQLGRYWRVVVQDFPRAMVRVDRALALASTEALERRCRLHRARVSIQWATYRPDDQRLQRLGSAKADLERIRQLQGRDDPSTLFESAWVADEEGRFDTAIELWRRGREEGLKDATGDATDLWLSTFNLACSLTRGDRFRDALDELRTLVGVLPIGSDWIQLASTDPDLEKLRRHPEWGPSFKRLLEEARQKFLPSPES